MIGSLVDEARERMTERRVIAGRRARHREVMAEVPQAGVEETDAAVARAKAAFPAWRAVAPGDRAALLHRLADALEEHARGPGPARGAQRRQADRATPAARWAWSSRPSATTPARPSGCSGETIPVAGGIDMTFREPLGVVGLITPWNFPLTIACVEARRRRWRPATRSC